MAVREDDTDGGAADGGGGPRSRAPSLEPRPFRPYRSHEEYLYALKEDLAEWLQALYRLPVGPDDFLDRLETGALLCQHANRVIAAARALPGGDSPAHPLAEWRELAFRGDAHPGTFHARDNVSNFIGWCRGALRVKECLLFETDDLVLRKNEKNVVLCLLEVGRKGVALGIPAPLLVQMEREIDAEIAGDGPPSSLSDGGHEADDEGSLAPRGERRQQIVTNDLRSLHERVAELLNRCSCPSQFPMIRVGDGKYRIGETQLLIFVRILRNHVMVRVGGGWDTLEHYLDKHDPCRCPAGRRISFCRVSPSNSSSGSLQVHVNSHRPLSSPSSSRSSSVPTSPPSRRRSFDMSRLSSPDDSQAQPISRGGSSDDCMPTSRRPHSRAKTGRPNSADSSSESEAYRGAADYYRRQRRYSPRKILKIGEAPPPATVGEESVCRRSRIPTSQSPSPRHRPRDGDASLLLGRRLSASRSETSLFQTSAASPRGRTVHQGRRGGQQQGARQRSSSSTRTASASPARTPSGDWGVSKRRTISLQSSPVKPVPPLLEEILHDSEVLDSDEKILERMERLINEYRAREDSSLSEDLSAPNVSPSAAKNRRRSSLSKIPVYTWHVRQ